MMMMMMMMMMPTTADDDMRAAAAADDDDDDDDDAGVPYGSEVFVFVRQFHSRCCVKIFIGPSVSRPPPKI